MADDIYDLRSFIKRLDEEGELARIKVEVDWKYELGEISRRAFGPPPGPALLFEKVKDYDIPVFTGGLHTGRRIAMALGLDPRLDEASLVQEYTRRLEHPIMPVMVKDGPCKENKYFGNEVDVLRFPVPWWNEKDGGRYIGTWHQMVVRDPETGWRNVGTYRMAVHERNICGMQFGPFQHIGLIYTKYEKMNRPMPMAVSIGTDPTAMLASVSAFPAGVDEWTMAGALRGRPLELVKGETVDLEIPAHSEIVLEGEVPPFERRIEGPFGEHTGYYGGDAKPFPIFKVSCITHRNKPIFRGTCVGRPVTEESRVLSFAFATQAMAMYKASGFPGVIATHFPAAGDPSYSAIIAIKKAYPSHGLDAARLLLSSKVGRFTKHLVVVDDNIDVFNLEQVLWAVNIRLQSGRDIYISRNETGSRLDPSVPREFMGVTDKMIVDATWKTTPDFPPREEWGGKVHPEEVAPSEELRRRVDKRWQEYGIKMPAR